MHARSLVAASAILILVALAQSAAAASYHHRHHAYHTHHRYGGFGYRDPDNIGPYGGRDFGFFEGPNGETTYDYGWRRYR